MNIPAISVLTLYNTLLIIFYIPLFLTGYLLSKNKSNFSNRIGINIPKKQFKSSFWFHAASVGEVRSLNLLIREIRNEYPQVSIIISTMTETGLETAKKELSPDAAFLLPIENTFVIKKYLKRYGVKVFFITDTEIWPNLINAVSKHCGLIMLNARISDRTLKTYIRFKFLFSYELNKFDYIFAKSADDASRFKRVASKANIKEGYNIKYKINLKPLSDEIFAIKAEIKGKIALAASTHAPEEQFFLNALKDTKDDFDKLVIVPRHIERSRDILQLAVNMGYSTALFSENTNEELIIVDKIGILEQFYQISDKIFIGGSISATGGHNIFEALQYEKNVCVGPNMQNFNDIAKLAEKYGMLSVVRTEEDLNRYFTNNRIENGNFQNLYEEIQKKEEDFKKALYLAINLLMEK